jgi:cytosine deaminase
LSAPPATGRPAALLGARLPAWALPRDWPRVNGLPARADLHLERGRVGTLRPSSGAPPADGAWQLDGSPVLPGLVDAHVHLDKTFTLDRAPATRPGLLGALEAMHRDRPGWTAPDLEARATRALQWAYAAGVVQLRTHVDWWEADTVPLGWQVLGRLAEAWRDRVALERVALVPLPLYADAGVADRIAGAVAASGAGACLGGFVHTVNWNPAALDHLLAAADRHGLDVDLHVDEELNPSACGLATLAARVQALRFGGCVVAGHACALAAQDDATTSATLDAVRAAGIVLVALPATNLLLQDAMPDRTPRLRGITLVKEARARGIPVLVASDNVQDAFCAGGSYDPVEALQLATLVAQLADAFDDASQMICRRDWLVRGAAARPLEVGAAADLVAFPQASPRAWPAAARARVVMRQGQVVSDDAFAGGPAGARSATLHYRDAA